MQKISSYKPMAESMPQMLREEAFHLAAGVVPMRRWVTGAARGDAFVTVDMLQRALNKWLPRGLEMFGDERGGGTNVRYGLKPMKNGEAQKQYFDEVEKLVRDLNMRYLRAKATDLTHGGSEAALDRILAGEIVFGVRREDLLHMPHAEFFRRRGVPAFTMVGVDGTLYQSFPDYLQHLIANLPEAYRASRDFKEYVEALSQVAAGTVAAGDAAGKMPTLRRVGGSCPCSKSVRWVVDDPRPLSAPTPEVGQPAVA
jgi:hypothetical protein